MPVDFDKLLESLSVEDLRETIRILSEKDDSVIGVLEKQVRDSLEFNEEEIRSDIVRVIRHLDDYAYLEASFVDKEVSDLYSEQKASAVIAEMLFAEFYDNAELMLQLGMVSEARGFVRAIAEGVRSCNDMDSIVVSLSKDFPMRYADNLESYLNSDDILGGFGKKD
jgi:hypothetical protein